MQTTYTIPMPEDLERRVVDVAEVLGISVNEVIYRALAGQLPTLECEALTVESPRRSSKAAAARITTRVFPLQIGGYLTERGTAVLPADGQLPGETITVQRSLAAA